LEMSFPLSYICDIELNDMAQNKKEEFDKDENEIADFAKALSHPARIAILKEIAKRETCICGEIVEVLPLAQSTVSQHLKELLKAGVIEGTIDGTKSCYCINWKVFEKFEKTFEKFFHKQKSFEEKRNCC
jgi:ArsR family transcriptional regulator, arsenate/arsenite/antimonite-responsive transcriptional repressor